MQGVRWQRQLKLCYATCMGAVEAIGMTFITKLAHLGPIPGLPYIFRMRWAVIGPVKELNVYRG